MTEAKQVLYEYLGSPDEYTFRPEDYMGPYGGVINALGLKYRGLIISGREMYNRVTEYSGRKVDRVEFMQALKEWAMEYIGSEVYQIGKRFIEQGRLRHGCSRYFCIPIREAEDRLMKQEGFDKKVQSL